MASFFLLVMGLRMGGGGSSPAPTLYLQNHSDYGRPPNP